MGVKELDRSRLSEITLFDRPTEFRQSGPCKAHILESNTATRKMLDNLIGQ